MIIFDSRSFDGRDAFSEHLTKMKNVLFTQLWEPREKQNLNRIFLATSWCPVTN